MKANNKTDSDRKRWPKPVDFVPEKTFPDDHQWSGALRCTAWNPNQGRQCGALALKVSRTQKCRVHGGKTPKGPASPNWKHGRYAKMPADLLDDYEEALNDTALLSLAREVAIIEAMMADVLRKWSNETGGAGARSWEDVGEALDFTFEALEDQDPVGVADGLRTIRKIVDGSQKSAGYRAEFLALADQKRNLVAAEGRRMRDMAESMTRGAVILYFQRMIEEIKGRSGRTIDGGLLIELADSFETILSGSRPRRALSSGGRDKSSDG